MPIVTFNFKPVSEKDMTYMIQRCDSTKAFRMNDITPKSLTANEDICSIVLTSDVKSLTANEDICSIVLTSDVKSLTANEDICSIMLTSDVKSLTANEDICSIVLTSDVDIFS